MSDLVEKKEYSVTAQDEKPLLKIIKKLSVLESPNSLIRVTETKENGELTCLKFLGEIDPMYTGHFSEGELRYNGVCEEENDKSCRKVRYKRKDGKIDGVFEELDYKIGQVIVTTEYKEGIQHGQRIIYCSDGSKFVREYKDGVPQNESIKYNRDGTKIVRKFEDGVYKVTTYNSEGKQINICEHNNDGTVLKEETYSDGVDITDNLERLKRVAKGNVSEEKDVTTPKRSELGKVTAMLKYRLSGNSGQ
jgi:hypothetical protein